ncbi:helix-turn-helix domain-containing protein [Kitasatospora sp. NPDC056651]|uniref:helix-turn-helix domain-containing protein n=1 Tax=Kitasatospora sp. NPDC056651 TaxID=3345892 RepID=UPI00367FA127
MRESQLDPSASPLKAFGAQLRRLRKAAGLTQTQLGDLTQLTCAFHLGPCPDHERERESAF